MSYFCFRCVRGPFKTAQAFAQHTKNSAMHHICYSCNEDFPIATGLITHFILSPRHPYCGFCYEGFDNWDDLRSHFDHVHFGCAECHQYFPFELMLHEHRCQVHSDEYCAPCKRMFTNNNALRHHERSTLHQGRTVSCPMISCLKSFVSRAALVHHLESGACPSRINRTMVNRIVSKLDAGGIITNPARLLEGGETVTRSWATEHAWNGAKYECYLCHRTFAKLVGLNQHLNSPAHAAKSYHCPGQWGGCGTEFNTLSGFCQHVESEQCGVHRFKNAMDKFVDELSEGKRLLA